jgi:hypothetical protein
MARHDSELELTLQRKNNANKCGGLMCFVASVAEPHHFKAALAPE